MQIDSRARPSLTCSVVIATRNRPEPIRETLTSLNRQTTLPTMGIVVDSSDGTQTEEIVARLKLSLSFPVIYRHTEIKSAAKQRNLGADLSSNDILLFMDDDLDLEPGCIAELLNVFENDSPRQIGGVSATITNQTYSDPKGLNRLLLVLVQTPGSRGADPCVLQLNFTSNYAAKGLWCKLRTR